MQIMQKLNTLVIETYVYVAQSLIDLYLPKWSVCALALRFNAHYHFISLEAMLYMRILE